MGGKAQRPPEGWRTVVCWGRGNLDGVPGVEVLDLVERQTLNFSFSVPGAFQAPSPVVLGQPESPPRGYFTSLRTKSIFQMVLR